MANSILHTNMCTFRQFVLFINTLGHIKYMHIVRRKTTYSSIINQIRTDHEILYKDIQ